MNKSELMERLSESNRIAIGVAEDVVNLVVDSMQEALASGKRIEIRGLGSFAVKSYPSYWGRNPKTGEKIFVSEKKLPTFKLGKDLKDRLNSDLTEEKTAGESGSDF